MPARASLSAETVGFLSAREPAAAAKSLKSGRLNSGLSVNVGVATSSEPPAALTSFFIASRAASSSAFDVGRWTELSEKKE